MLILGEGLRAVQNGGVYVNGRQVKVGETVAQVLLDGKVLVIRFGRSSFRIVEVLSEEEEEIEGYAKGM
jgi:ribosomal 50S subunit-recycling heat shock protein